MLLTLIEGHFVVEGFGVALRVTLTLEVLRRHRVRDSLVVEPNVDSVI